MQKPISIDQQQQRSAVSEVRNQIRLDLIDRVLARITRIHRIGWIHRSGARSPKGVRTQATGVEGIDRDRGGGG